jgi:hypothetical protein
LQLFIKLVNHLGRPIQVPLDDLHYLVASPATSGEGVGLDSAFAAKPSDAACTDDLASFMSNRLSLHPFLLPPFHG